jgi:hypothetical protein
LAIRNDIPFIHSFEGQETWLSPVVVLMFGAVMTFVSLVYSPATKHLRLDEVGEREANLEAVPQEEILATVQKLLRQPNTKRHDFQTWRSFFSELSSLPAELYADKPLLSPSLTTKSGTGFFTKLYPALPEFTDNWPIPGFEYLTEGTVDKEKHKS